MRFGFFVILLVLSQKVYALEVDEKLTMRILKTSKSKKTVLINRGVEDGLAEGDHAKFFLSVGVVGRGVLVKLSPTRSVWSVYRLVNADYIKVDQVMNLKITPPVKITKDDSRMLVADDSPNIISDDPRDLGIPIAVGGEDMSQEEIAGLESKGNGTAHSKVENKIFDRPYELFATIHLSEMKSSLASSDSSSSTTGSESFTQFSAGGEYYFKDQESWLSKISLVGLVSFSRRGVMSYQGATVSESTTEFGGGVNIYPMDRHGEVLRFIPYLSGIIAFGQSSAEYSPGNENPGASAQSLSASVVTYILGGGFKYYLGNGFGARITAEYYQRADSYSEDADGISWLKTRTGLRTHAGFSYRF